MSSSTKTSGSRLARHSFYNLVSLALPLALGVLTVPLYLERLGPDRYGVLSIGWVIVGYFSLFDLGLGLALTQLVSEWAAKGRERELPALIWTGLGLMLALGLLGAVIVVASSGALAQHVFKMPEELRGEGSGAFVVMGLSLPFVISTAGLSGVLNAKERFDLTSLLRLTMGLATTLGALAVTFVTRHLAWVVSALLVVRIAIWAVHLYLCLRVLPELRRGAVDRVLVRPLLRFGGWVTVSNVVSPIMTNLDRFLIGALISAAAVAYYVAPYETVTRLWIIPASLTATLLPSFAACSPSDGGARDLLFERGVKFVFMALYPVALLVVTFAPEMLRLWLGAEFARQSAPVMRIIMVGVFVNSLAHVAQAFILGGGRPEVSAKLHLLELPLYLALLWWLTRAWGITGTAAAWTLRVTLDAAALFAVIGADSQRLKAAGYRTALAAVAAVLSLGAGWLCPGLPAKFVFCSAAVLGFAALCWQSVMTIEERRFILVRLRGFSGA
jgi:O-antigen/teichoic acid export membrane protein